MKSSKTEYCVHQKIYMFLKSLKLGCNVDKKNYFLVFCDMQFLATLVALHFTPVSE